MARRLYDARVRWVVNLLLTSANICNIRTSLEVLLNLGASSVTLLCPKDPWAARYWPGFLAAGDLEALAFGIRKFVANNPLLRLYVDTALRSEWKQAGLFEDPEPNMVGCGGGQRHTAVTPEGNVYSCSHAIQPALRIGNLLRDEPGQLWLDRGGRKARRRFVQSCQGARCVCSGSLANVTSLT